MLDPINFIRNVSGLYVPPLIGLAVNPLGRFQPCAGDCCGGDTCFGCSNEPETLWVDMPGLIDNDPNCPEGGEGCLIYDGTFLLSRSGPCKWIATYYNGCDNGGQFLTGVWEIQARVYFDTPLFPAQCSVSVILLVGIGGWITTWLQSFSSFQNPINFPAIPFYSEGTSCSGAGTTVALYE